MASRDGDRRKGLSRWRKAVEKQKVRWRASEHTCRDREREERAEENRGQVMYTTFLAGGEGVLS